MKVLSISFFLIAALSCSSASYAQQRTITVIGTSQVSSKSVKEVAITLDANDPSAVAAGAKLESLEAKMRGVLAGHGVPKAELQQTASNFFPNFEYNVNGPKITGYRLQRSYKFDVGSKTSLPVILDALREIGASGVVIKDENEKEGERSESDELRSAVKAARNRAAILAREANAELGAILSISTIEQSANSMPLTEEQRERGMAASTADGTGGTSLRVTFELK